MDTLPCVILEHITSLNQPEWETAHGVLRYKDYRYDGDPTSFSFGRTLVYKVENAFSVTGLWLPPTHPFVHERFVLACFPPVPGVSPSLLDSFDDSPYMTVNSGVRRYTGDEFDPFIDVPGSRYVKLRRAIVLNKSIRLYETTQGFDISSEHLKRNPVQPARKRYITASWCM